MPECSDLFYTTSLGRVTDACRISTWPHQLLAAVNFQGVEDHLIIHSNVSILGISERGSTPFISMHGQYERWKCTFFI